MILRRIVVLRNEKSGLFGPISHRRSPPAWTSVAYMDVGKGREYDHMDVGGRTNQETESRSGSLPPCRVSKC
jgi:hypothetical protein